MQNNTKNLARELVLIHYPYKKRQKYKLLSQLKLGRIYAYFS